jgi:hypothetical protein
MLVMLSVIDEMLSAPSYRLREPLLKPWFCAREAVSYITVVEMLEMPHINFGRAG